MNPPIVRPNPTPQLPVVQSSAVWTTEQMALITSVVAPGATPNELKLFLYRCERMGLDPLKAGQIFFIKYGNNPGTIVVGIEGFRSRAARTGKLKGIKRGVLRNAEGACVGAWAKVKRSDWDEAAEVEVSFAEYDTGKAEWAKKPETMIQKVAEAAALRMAFPDELGDAYAPEEMDKKALEPRPIVGEQPHATDGDPEHVDENIKFGQWKGFSIDWVLKHKGPDKLANYIGYLEDPKQVASRKPEQVQMVANFIEQASDAIAAYEQEIAAQMGARQ